MDTTADLANDETRADALVTVTARPAVDATQRTALAEILVMDKSLSMAGRKLDEAKRAMCAAIDTLRDGTRLGIVAGTHKAEVIYPATGGLAVVDATAKEAAKNRVAAQLAEGGTAIGQWLACADRLFETVTAPGTVRHAVLYTDGKDEHETPEQLGEVLKECTDRFVCDVRGLGEDWQYKELLRITEALHGDAQAVVTVSDLTEDFTRLIRQAQRIVVARAYLGLHLNDWFQLAFVRQTLPVQAALTARQQQGDEIHVPIGSWPPETRQYQVSLRFDPEALPVEERLRAARITLYAEGPDGTREPCSEMRPMVVQRRAAPGFPIPPPESFTRIEAEYELGLAMRACADAQQAGDFERADRELRIAVGLAQDLRDAARREQLRKVSATGPDGRLKVRRDASRGEMQELGLASTRTAAPPVDAIDATPAPGALRRRCPQCGETTSAGSVAFCEACGHRLDDGADGGTDGAPVGTS
ncbi:VWA domain-containing protein [Streptomyces sp. NPDC002088]|uniref:vWA domain-containing protein n=1 Tax=Streptomyces sp. NPDC002088 TaxID=3154665 RepID=UPI00332A14B4